MIAVEWSEDQQAFHKNENKPEYTHGWKTAIRVYTNEDADKVIKHLIKYVVTDRTNVRAEELKQELLKRSNLAQMN